MRIDIVRPRHASLAPVLILCATLAATACGGGGGTTGPGLGGGTGGGGGGVTPPGPVSTTSVTIKGLAFNPPDILVAKGATVTFSNQDAVDHNATFDDPNIGRSGNLGGGSTTSLLMPTTAGTYPYHCTIHAGMNGSVKVE